MSEVLKNVDQDGLPVYLGTDKKINVTFYKRFGFKVLNEKKIPNTNLTLWYLMRETQNK